MSKNFKKGWHVLYVKSCQEKKVHELLLENQLESFLPMIKTVRQWSDRKKTLLKPLFPSYVFVNIKTTLEFHKTLSVNGACTFIRFGNQCALATEKEINQIKFLIGEEGFSDLEVNSTLPKVGEKTLIKIGALSGLECEILNINNKNKIIVRIESLQQNIIATINSKMLSESLNVV